MRCRHNFPAPRPARSRWVFSGDKLSDPTAASYHRDRALVHLPGRHDGPADGPPMNPPTGDARELRRCRRHTPCRPTACTLLPDVSHISHRTRIVCDGALLVKGRARCEPRKFSAREFWRLHRALRLHTGQYMASCAAISSTRDPPRRTASLPALRTACGRMCWPHQGRFQLPQIIEFSPATTTTRDQAMCPGPFEGKEMRPSARCPGPRGPLPDQSVFSMSSDRKPCATRKSLRLVCADEPARSIGKDF